MSSGDRAGPDRWRASWLDLDTGDGGLDEVRPGCWRPRGTGPDGGCNGRDRVDRCARLGVGPVELSVSGAGGRASRHAQVVARIEKAG